VTPTSRYAVAAAAAFAAGLVNAVAGGGTLLSFPALIALGLPALDANMTNTVGLTAGYVGGSLAQRRDLAGRSGLRFLLLAGALGGLSGGILLRTSSEALFRKLVPHLILRACVLLFAQEPLKRRLAAGAREGSGRVTPTVLIALVVAGLYGGYFGAALSIMLLGGLGLVLDGSLTQLNAIKQALSGVINAVAAVYFAVAGRVHWQFAAVMMIFSLAGGHLGGRVAARLPPRALRAVVIVVGTLVAARLLIT
jgi:uncharacterized membrane protein YfcA